MSSTRFFITPPLTRDEPRDILPGVMAIMTRAPDYDINLALIIVQLYQPMGLFGEFTASTKIEMLRYALRLLPEARLTPYEYGPGWWKTIHLLADLADRDHVWVPWFYKFIAFTRENMPCSECRKHFFDMTVTLPKSGFLRWSILAHENANKMRPPLEYGTPVKLTEVDIFNLSEKYRGINSRFRILDLGLLEGLELR